MRYLLYRLGMVLTYRDADSGVEYTRNVLRLRVIAVCSIIIPAIVAAIYFGRSEYRYLVHVLLALAILLISTLLDTAYEVKKSDNRRLQALGGGQKEIEKDTY